MRHGRITASMFAQVIQLIGIHFSKDDIDKLASAYNDPENNFVDYPAFIKDVNDNIGLVFGDRASDSLVVPEIQPYMLGKSDHVVQTRSVVAASWPGLKERVHTFITKRSIRLYEFFQGFDELRSGKVTVQKFGTGCSQAGIELSEADIEVVKATFGEPVDYRAFCAQVDDAFDLVGLEKKPTLDPATLTKPATRSMAGAETNETKLVLGKIAAIISARRMNIRDQFYDYDKNPRKGFISAQQFKQGVARMGLSTRPSEMALLVAKYKVSDYGDIDYRAFCEDVDPAAASV